jgi:alanyl-tRNA synthetase
MDIPPGAATRRLYFEDAYLVEFEAEVVERSALDGRPAVVLDQTAFYPESGGQPWDRGILEGAAVLEVVENGDRIVHVLDRPLPAASRVRGRVDWDVRFDHMQQHTGQHILSQAFVEVLNGETKSFHLGPESTTLEIGIGSTDDAGVARVEGRANAIVFQNRPVKTYFVPPERIGEVPFRRPPKKEGTLRVVEVDDFDHSACGGTHCRATGEVGLIKILRWERIRGNLRFEFVCGGRALADYASKNAAVRDLVGRFNVRGSEVPEAVERLAAEVKALKKDARRLEESLASYEARDIAAKARSRVLRAVFRDRSPEAVRSLALHVVKQGVFAVVYAGFSPARCHLILARSEGLDLDLRTLVPVVAPLVQGRGGGGPTLVEIAGDPGADVEAALARATEAVEATLSAQR